MPQRTSPSRRGEPVRSPVPPAAGRRPPGHEAALNPKDKSWQS
ncbi:hypothetical protein ISF6_4894 [Piscinibacter sakaiensis]|uniref:Uncharacterized protein n=1 Tax=Piscinibacter sakaiensis TaxID=1547922 RepID=A0A0K8P741_PISS1|nr:hypothetical protein ISF6_4894 [Piscinibacter sakaiensis]